MRNAGPYIVQGIVYMYIVGVCACACVCMKVCIYTLFELIMYA